MMRIVCPNCGEEPRKGQRHVCKPKAELFDQPPPTPSARPPGARLTAADFGDSLRQGLGGIQRRSAPAASPGAVCASVGSLLSKNPSLWRSGRALARAGGEEFVAALLAVAVNDGWHKDPKRALISALSGRVADEAARAVQDHWRARCRARQQQRRPPKVSQGYRQLELAGPVAAPPPRRSAPSNGGVPSGRPVVARNPVVPEQQPMVVAGGANAYAPPQGGAIVRAPSTPRQPETPRNRSNPRPTGARAVPMNPIHALKQRKMQQHQEEAEKRMKQLQEMDDRNASARAAAVAELHGSAMAVVPASPSGDESHDMNFGLDLCKQGLLPPRSADSANTASDFTTQLPSKGHSSAPSTPRSYNSGRPPPAPPQLIHEDSTVVAALEDQHGKYARNSPPGSAGRRPSSANSTRRSSSPSSCARSASMGSATERLRERMLQRERGQQPTAVSNATPYRPRDLCEEGGAGAAPAQAQSSWQLRIEARQRETEELQEQETMEKKAVAERSGKRSDAMRRVMERQAQRQQDVLVLEE